MAWTHWAEFLDVGEFEREFPDKTEINLYEAWAYIEGHLEITLSEDHLRPFLESLGYQKIFKPTPRFRASDLKIEANLFDFEQRRMKVPDPTDSPAYKRNKKLLEQYAETQDEAVFEALIVNNLGLVHKAASSFWRWPGEPLDVDDLISEGIIGLMMGIRKFDASRGSNLSTYATYWITQQIWRAAITQSSTIRVPENIRTRIQSIQDVEQKYLKQGAELKKKEYAKTLASRSNNITVLGKWRPT